MFLNLNFRTKPKFICCENLTLLIVAKAIHIIIEVDCPNAIDELTFFISCGSQVNVNLSLSMQVIGFLG